MKLKLSNIPQIQFYDAFDLSEQTNRKLSEAMRNKYGLFIITKQVTLYVDGCTYPSICNSVLLFPPKTEVFFDITAFDEKSDIYVVLFDSNIDDYIKNENIEPSSQYLAFVTKDIFSYITSYRKIQRALLSTTLLETIKINSLLYQMIEKCIGDYAATMQKDDVFYKVLSFIDNHYTEPLLLQDISDRFDINYKMLERRFKAHSGKSPQQYIADLRFERAEDLLKNTMLTIEEVSAAVGFADKFHFSKQFKKGKGMSPGEYRKKYGMIPALPAMPVAISTKTKTVISNYNRVSVYRNSPKRIVCLSYFAAELCIALGLSDRIVGIAEAEGSTNDLFPEYAENILGFHKIPLRSTQKTMPSFDDIIALHPDFAYGCSYSFISQSGIADVVEFDKHCIDIYVAKATYTTPANLQDVYEDILNLGKIFGREVQSRYLVRQLQDDFQKIKAEVDAHSDAVKKVLLYRGEQKGRVLAVGMSLESHLLTMVNGYNIFGNYPTQRVSKDWSDIVSEDPDVIIVYESSYDIATETIYSIKSNPLLKNISAVANGKVFSIRLEHTFPGLHIAEITRKLHKYLSS